MFETIAQYLRFIGASLKQEFKNIFKDSAAVITYIVMSVLVCILYSYIYSNEVITKIPIAVVDQDQTPLSRNVVRMLGASQQLKVSYVPSSLLSARKLYDQGKIRGIVLVSENFSRELQKGIAPSIVIYADASYILYYKQLLTAANTVVGTFKAQIEVKKIMSGGIPQKQAVASRRPVEAVSRPLFNINSGYGTFLMPVVFLIGLQTLQLSAMGLIGGTQREKKIFIKSYGLNKPITSILSVIGRSLAYLIISLSIIIFLNGVVIRWFSFPQRGNPEDIILFLIPFILAVTFLGISLVNFFKHREDALMTITVFSIPALFLCGVSWPTIAFPEWIQYFSYFVPTTLGVKGFVEISQFGAKLWEIKKLWFQMWGISLFYFITAVLTTLKIAYKEKKVIK